VGFEQRGDRERGNNDGKLRQLLLSRERQEESLGRRHAPKYTSASINVSEP
jgi:hypothetical protein